MKTKLVRVVTSDKLVLHGVLYTPEKGTDKVVVHIHGMGGNFYENHFVDLMAEEFTKNGVAFLTGNNRGHEQRSLKEGPTPILAKSWKQLNW